MKVETCLTSSGNRVRHSKSRRFLGLETATFMSSKSTWFCNVFS
jgi:hypothetical protein